MVAMDLSAAEIRVLGCLLEKQRTTPDQYPLTLNSLRLACNQATNRDPVVQYDEDVLREAVRTLGRRGYIRFASGHSSRAAKYRHLLGEALPMSDAETAVMCVLMLRGAQTPGELKQRTDRMHPFESLGEVNEVLEQLIERGLAQRLDRRPGQKEERYIHLLDRDADPASSEPSGANRISEPSAEPRESGLAERVTALEREVADLRAVLAKIEGDEEGQDESPVEEPRVVESEHDESEHDEHEPNEEWGSIEPLREEVAQPGP